MYACCIFHVVFSCCKKNSLPVLCSYCMRVVEKINEEKNRVIFFRVWNALWCCGILCYIFPRVYSALVLWNFVLYISVCGTRYVIVLYFPTCGTCSGIAEFRVLFSCVWNALCYCGILLIFFHALKFLVEIIKLLFVHMCCIFHVVLFVLYFLVLY